MPKAELTPDEIKALKECNKESFWYRCLPAGVVCVTTTQLLTSRGILTPHPKYGALLKNIAAATVAYFMGKLSYQEECRQKIMRLENSPLAEAMRRGKRGAGLFSEGALETTPGLAYQQQVEGPVAAQPMGDQAAVDINSDDNIQAKGLDDTFRPSTDSSEGLLRSQPQDANTFTSYEDLRRQNRVQFEQRAATARSPVAAPQTPSRPAPIWDDDRPGQRQKPVRRNEYGDIIES